MKDLKAFIKPSDAPQIQLLIMHCARRVKKKTLEQRSSALPGDLLGLSQKMSSGNTIVYHNFLEFF